MREGHSYAPPLTFRHYALRRIAISLSIMTCQLLFVKYTRSHTVRSDRDFAYLVARYLRPEATIWIVRFFRQNLMIVPFGL